MAAPSDAPPDWPGAAIFRGPEGPDLVAELAHTLRSRLTSIMFLTESLHASTDTWRDDQLRQLALLNDSAVKMSVFTANVMTLARGGEELVGIESQPFSVAELLGATCEALRPLDGAPEVSLSLDDAAAGQRLGHPMALQRTMAALAAAALELTSEGEIEIAARARGDTAVEFTVRARGAPSPPDSPAALEAAVTPRPDGDGWSWSPVGLSIGTARHVLGRIGVELHMETGSERGLRFYFDADLPPLDTRREVLDMAKVPKAMGTEEPAASRTETDSGAAPTAPSVLLVEDDRETSAIYSQYLISHGYRVLMTADALEGTRLAGLERPAMILMDLSLPGMDGHAAMRRLKQDAATSAIPILAMTASSLDADRRRAYESGCNAFVEKPCRPPKLLRAVERLLAGRSVPE